MDKINLFLIACSSKKLDRPAPARELYTGQLFNKSLAYAKQLADEILILSAKHLVLLPEKIVSPYDMSLNNFQRADMARWNDGIKKYLENAGYFSPHRTITVLAGNNYCGWCAGVENVSRPLRGMGIGKQLQFLSNKTRNPYGAPHAP